MENLTRVSSLTRKLTDLHIWQAYFLGISGIRAPNAWVGSCSCNVWSSSLGLGGIPTLAFMHLHQDSTYLVLMLARMLSYYCIFHGCCPNGWPYLASLCVFPPLVAWSRECLSGMVNVHAIGWTRVSCQVDNQQMMLIRPFYTILYTPALTCCWACVWVCCMACRTREI